MGAAVGGAVRGITAGVRAAAPKAVGALGRIGTSLKGVATGSGIRAQGQLAQQAGAKATRLREAAAPLSPGKMKDWRLHRAAEAGKQATTARWGQVKEVGKTVGLYGGGSAALGGAGYGALSGPPQPKLAAFQDAFFDELEKIGGIGTIARIGGKAAPVLAPAISAGELAFSQHATRKKYRSGEIDRGEYKTQTGGNVGSASGGLGGALGGAAVGAALGSVVPVAGTAIGGIAGGIAGGLGGGFVGKRLGRFVGKRV